MSWRLPRSTPAAPPLRNGVSRARACSARPYATRSPNSQTKPNVAVQAQTGFIQNDKAIMITGSVSSATAIALEELAQRDKVLNMVGAVGLQRHHRQGLPALRLPLAAVRLHGVQGAGPGGGQGARQRT